MSRQSLATRELAIVLEELDGQITTKRARDHLKARGYLTIDDDAIYQWELSRARKIIEDTREFRRKTGEIQLEFINLYEKTDDGKRKKYYRKFGEISLPEGVQLLTYWHGYEGYGAKEKMRYFKALAKKFGLDQVQQALPFDLLTPV